MTLYFVIHKTISVNNNRFVNYLTIDIQRIEWSCLFMQYVTKLTHRDIGSEAGDE